MMIIIIHILILIVGLVPYNLHASESKTMAESSSSCSSSSSSSSMASASACASSSSSYAYPGFSSGQAAYSAEATKAKTADKSSSSIRQPSGLKIDPDLKDLITIKLGPAFIVLAAFLGYQKSKQCSLAIPHHTPSYHALSPDQKKLYEIGETGGNVRVFDFEHRKQSIVHAFPLIPPHKILGLWTMSNGRIVVSHMINEPTTGLINQPTHMRICSFDAIRGAEMTFMVDIDGAEKASLNRVKNGLAVRSKRHGIDQFAVYESSNLYSSKKITLPPAGHTYVGPFYSGTRYAFISADNGVTYVYDFKSEGPGWVAELAYPVRGARKIISFPGLQFALMHRKSRETLTFFGKDIEVANYASGGTRSFNDMIKVSKNRCTVSTNSGMLNCFTVHKENRMLTSLSVHHGKYSMSKKDRNHVWTCSDMGHVRLMRVPHMECILSLDDMRMADPHGFCPTIMNVSGGYAIRDRAGIDYYPEKSDLEVAFALSMVDEKSEKESSQIQLAKLADRGSSDFAYPRLSALQATTDRSTSFSSSGAGALAEKIKP